MSRFTKETFPEKWQILITKENFGYLINLLKSKLDE